MTPVPINTTSMPVDTHTTGSFPCVYSIFTTTAPAQSSGPAVTAIPESKTPEEATATLAQPSVQIDTGARMPTVPLIAQSTADTPISTSITRLDEPSQRPSYDPQNNPQNPPTFMSNVAGMSTPTPMPSLTSSPASQPNAPTFTLTATTSGALSTNFSNKISTWGWLPLGFGFILAQMIIWHQIGK